MRIMNLFGMAQKKAQKYKAQQQTLLPSGSDSSDLP